MDENPKPEVACYLRGVLPEERHHGGVSPLGENLDLAVWSSDDHGHPLTHAVIGRGKIVVGKKVTMKQSRLIDWSGENDSLPNAVIGPSKE